MPGLIHFGLMAAMIAATISASILPGFAADDLKGYSPANQVGSGEKDWWISFPDQSPSAGSSVNHLQWIIEALAERPVVILVRSTICAPCIVQKGDLEKVLVTYGSDVTYYELVDGTGDQRVSDVLFAYYPYGGMPTVPTTVLLTLVKNKDGKVAVGWHAMNDAMGEVVITSYIKDAIFYYGQNAAAWS